MSDTYIFKRRILRILFKYLDTFGCFVLKILKKDLHQKAPSVWESILLVRFDGVGDILNSSSIFKIIKTKSPKTKIYLLTHSEGMQIVKNNPYLEEIFETDLRWFSHQKRKLFDIIRLYKTIQLIRKQNLHFSEKIQLAIDLRGDLRIILLLKLAGIKLIAGNDATGGKFLLNYRANYDRKKHELEYLRELIGKLGIETNSDQEKAECPFRLVPEVFITAEEKLWARDYINREAERPLRFDLSNKLLVLIHPGASCPSKRWSIKNFKSLIKRLQTIEYLQVVLLGSASEQYLLDQIKEKDDFSKVKIISNRSRCSALSWRETMSIISEADLFIGHDSAPAHIAAALKINTLIIFSGVSNPAVWAPRGEHVNIIYHKVPCAGCELRECKEKGLICLEGISGQEVFEQAKNILTSLKIR